jgi:hypothetical protein
MSSVGPGKIIFRPNRITTRKLESLNESSSINLYELPKESNLMTKCFRSNYRNQAQSWKKILLFSRHFDGSRISVLWYVRPSRPDSERPWIILNGRYYLAYYSISITDVEFANIFTEGYLLKKLLSDRFIMIIVSVWESSSRWFCFQSLVSNLIFAIE